MVIKYIQRKNKIKKQQKTQKKCDTKRKNGRQTAPPLFALQVKSLTYGHTIVLISESLQCTDVYTLKKFKQNKKKEKENPHP